MDRSTLAVLLALLLAPAGRAADIDSALEGLANVLGDQIQKAAIQRVGVPEFLNGEGNLGGETGAIGLYASRRLQLRLQQAAHQRFKVIERQRLQKVLEEEKVQASGLTSAATAQTLIGRIDGLDGMVIGTMTRIGADLLIDAQVVKFPTAEVVGGGEAKVAMDADLMAEGGYRVVSSRRGGTVNSDDIRGAIERRRAGQPAPDAGLPYGMQILVDSRERTVYRHEGDFYIGFRKGETYRVRLLNRTAESVAVALYIDGLNSLWQERTLPSKGRKWILKPHSSAIIPGWQMDRTTAREFVIVGFAESLAARQDFTEQIGLITAAFYPEADGSEQRGAIGTGEGQPVESHTKPVSFNATKQPAAIIALRYDRSDVVERYQRVKP